jgi:two-component system nitrogen regulation response regulator NtrX
VILIVDDEAGIRESLRRFLVQRRFEVSTAATPTEALQLLRQTRPNVMILDIRMPDPAGQMRSGLDLLRFVREQPSFAGMPVLVLTGHMLSDEEQATLQDCRAEVLYKPLELHRLSDHLAALSAAGPGPVTSSD